LVHAVADAAVPARAARRPQGRRAVIVLVAGADGRVGGLLVALLLGRGHEVRGLVRDPDQGRPLEEIGATPLVGDLRGDVEWAADGCDAAIFAAGARHRADLGAIDAGGAAKLAEAADRYDLSRFVLCSAVGADTPERRDGPAGEFLAAKQHAEHRLERLDMPWTILRFGRLTDEPGTGRISVTLPPHTPVTLSRDDAALAVAEALDRRQLAQQVVHVIDGDVHVAEALDAIDPRSLPPTHSAGLAAGQSETARADPRMLYPDARPFDADVDYEGEGPEPTEQVGNDDPAPGIP
jgi:nucleoside-diphosphate-sugar epimerase